MSEWKKTGCVLCAQNCGLNVLYHQYSADRITKPLKRTEAGFEPVSWDRAMGEIAAGLKTWSTAMDPRSIAYMGSSAQGGHCEGAFGLGILEALGSKYFYNSAGLVYDGERHGINVNRLTKNTHRDPLGTPLHRFIPCRIDAAGGS